jgi:hypothetical protein
MAAPCVAADYPPERDLLRPGALPVRAGCGREGAVAWTRPTRTIGAVRVFPTPDLVINRHPVTRYALALLLLLAAPIASEGQELPAPPETVADTAAISPRGALVRSLLVPGWGQSYIGAPGRGAIYFGAEVGSLWMVYKSRQQLRAARQLERHLLDTGRLREEERLDLVLSRQRQQEDWITLAIFILLFSGADAYVAAQLADFDERFGVRPEADGTFRIEARVPVGRLR